MKRARATRKPSSSRAVFYGWQTRTDDAFDETAMEKVLLAAWRRGVVTRYDTGRGSVVWFEGPPGRAMRAVKAAVTALLPKTATLLVTRS